MERGLARILKYGFRQLTFVQNTFYILDSKSPVGRFCTNDNFPKFARAHESCTHRSIWWEESCKTHFSGEGVEWETLIIWVPRDGWYGCQSETWQIPYARCNLPRACAQVEDTNSFYPFCDLRSVGRLWRWWIASQFFLYLRIPYLNSATSDQSCWTPWTLDSSIRLTANSWANWA